MKEPIDGPHAYPGLLVPGERAKEQHLVCSGYEPEDDLRTETFLPAYCDQLCAISILDVSRMNHDSQQSYRVHDDVTLATHHLLTSIIATRPPFSNWLSMIAALGVGCLLIVERWGSASWTPSQAGSICTLSARVGACGSYATGRSTYTMPLTTSRRLGWRKRMSQSAGVKFASHTSRI